MVFKIFRETNYSHTRTRIFYAGGEHVGTDRTRSVACATQHGPRAGDAGGSDGEHPVRILAPEPLRGGEPTFS